MLDWNAQRELESEANAAYDYVQEAFGDTRIPADWNQPTLSDLLFRSDYFSGEAADGLVLVTPDYCSGVYGRHVLWCQNAPVEDEPPF